MGRLERGQSLVEMTVIAPLLLFMFLGLIEIGWAIRGKMVLIQATREAARYAVRSDNEWHKPGWEMNYSRVYTHFLIATDLPFVENGGTLIIKRYDVFIGRPCLTIPCNSCDPIFMDPDTSDDVLIGPSQALSYTMTFGPERASRIDDQARLEEIYQEALRLNCYKDRRPAGAFFSPHDSILVEALYDQPQILGVPIISNRYTDPIFIYSHTQMRIP